MDTLESLLAGPLFEETSEDVTGWEKETVHYVLDNKEKIMRQISGIAKSKRKQPLQVYDVEDLYATILEYLYKSDDYNLNKAVDRSSTGALVSLEGYVNVCIKFCVIRYCNEMRIPGDGKELVSDVIISGEDKELSIFDTMPDHTSDITLDHLMFDLRTLCDCCTPVRYKYGPDIFLILYVRLLTSFDTTGHAFKNALSVLGITKKDLSNIEKNSGDEVVCGLTKAITLIEYKEAIEILEDYVYSSCLIKNMINSYM